MGDAGYVGKDGNLFITGRLKEIIVLKNAKKTNSVAIEAIFNGCPYVKEVCVKARVTRLFQEMLLKKEILLKLY